MTGGTVVNGTYVLVSTVQYAGSGAGSKTHERTLRITGTKLELVNSDDNGPEARVTVSFSQSGNALNETASCGLFGLGNYTASATNLVINKSGTNQVQTYNKQ